MSKPVNSWLIKRADLYLLKLPLLKSFMTGFGNIDSKETVLVKLTDLNGIEGWGESPTLSFPMYSYETSLTSYLALKKYILPLIVGKSFTTPQNFINAYKNVRGYNFAKNAVEGAFWIIQSTHKNRPLYELFGGTKKQIEIGESIEIKPTLKALMKDVETSLKRGYRRIKVKIQPGWDIKAIHEIRKRYPNIELMADANSSYKISDLSILKSLDNFNLTMIEQPLNHDDIIEHSFLQKKLSTPICLDESILSVKDAENAIKIGACKIINIKPARVGGILESIKIHNLCENKKIGVWCGGLLETGIGRAFNISLCSLPNFIYPADMSPYYNFYSEDLINPSYDMDTNGMINVSDKPGLGYNINKPIIKKLTIEKFVLS